MDVQPQQYHLWEVLARERKASLEASGTAASANHLIRQIWRSEG